MNIYIYIYIYIPLSKLRSLGYVFVADSMNIASVNSTQMAPKVVVLREITRNDGSLVVQGHTTVQGHQFRYQSKARIQLPTRE